MEMFNQGVVLFIIAVFGKKGRKVCGVICAAIIVLTFPYIPGFDSDNSE